MQAQLIAENEELRARLAAAETMLRALHRREADATGSGGADRVYRALLDGMNEGALTLTSDGMILYANRRFAALLQTPPEQVVGAVIDAWLTPESQNIFRGLLGERAAARRSAELALIARDGSQRMVEFVVNPLAAGALADTFCVTVTDLTEHKRVEQVIEDQLAEITFHYDNAPVGLAALDTDLRFLRINNLLAEINGIPVADHIGKPVEEIVPDLAAQARQLAATILATGQPVTEIEFSGETAAQPGVTRFWVEGWHPLKRHDQEVIGFSVIVQEITERKHAEAALRQSEALLRLVTDSLPAYVAYVSAPDLRYRFVNRQYEIAFQRLREQMIGQPVSSILSEANFAFALPYIERALQGEACSYENAFPLAGGERWIQVHFVPSLDQSGRVSGIVILNHDITERKQGEIALSEAEQRFHSMFERHKAIMLLIEPHGGAIVDANTAATEFYGYPLAELRRLKIDDINLLPPEQVAAERQRALAEQRNYFVFPHRLASGEVRTVEVHSTPIAVGGQPLLFSIIHDITARVHAEEEHVRLQAQLAQAQKMELVGRLAGGVAHDFNNMLAVIMMRTEMALKFADPATPLHRSLTAIYSTAQRSAELVRKLLGFARRQVIAPKVLDLNEALGGMLPMLHNLLGEEIELAWHPGEHLWPVKIDPSQIDQILVNLCVNARDAIAGVGEITIETANIHLAHAMDANSLAIPPGDYVMLAVRDSGNGMDQELLAHIFEPFFTTKEVGKGTGLGLATVDGIVQQNGGHIQVFSTPGAGTTFKIYLPHFAEAAAATTASGSPALPRGRGETVLLVEDEAVVLQMVNEALQDLGYMVIAATAPNEAIRQAESRGGAIDLLMTDIVMPEMNGGALAERIAALQPGIKRLFVSGYPAEFAAQRGALGSGVHFLQKPFSLQDLATKLREALGESMVSTLS